MLLRLLTIATLLASVAASGARADSITLRTSAVLAPDVSVRLADVATLEGAEAERLGATVLVANAGAKGLEAGWFSVTLNQVRDALANEKVNWGRVSLRGSACTVRVRAVSADAGPTASATQAPSDSSASTGPVVRDIVRGALRRVLGVDDADLRVTWDRRDDDFLRRPLWGVRVETQPSTSNSSARQAIAVRLYEGQTLLEERSVRADVQVHTPVLTLTRQIERRESIRESDLAAQKLWMAPDGARPISSHKDAVGRVAESRLEAGLVLRESHVQQPIAVKRGERVIVHCISGGIALKAKARALSDGRIGQSVEMRLEGRDGTFMARVSGQGVAVLNLDAGAHVAASRESM